MSCVVCVLFCGVVCVCDVYLRCVSGCFSCASLCGVFVLFVCVLCELLCVVCCVWFVFGVH